MVDWHWVAEKLASAVYTGLLMSLGYWMGKQSRRVPLKADRTEQLLALLSETIGDDDPRTYEEDWQWRARLAGKQDHDHIEVSVYAVTLKRILDEVRPGWELPPREE